jgi:hypothetical protein
MGAADAKDDADAHIQIRRFETLAGQCKFSHVDAQVFSGWAI